MEQWIYSLARDMRELAKNIHGPLAPEQEAVLQDAIDRLAEKLRRKAA